jgi:hypothetical protein
LLKNNHFYFSLFVNEKSDLKNEESSEYNSRLGLEELIIENNKRLLTTNNRSKKSKYKKQT